MKNKLIFYILILLCFFMVMFPKLTMLGTKEAIDMWLDKIVPILLPFFIISNYIKGFDVSKIIPISIYPFAMAFFSGYPMGAKVAGDLYSSKLLDDHYFKYILSYSMVTSPAFIIGTVGVGFLNSYKWGIAIALGHYIGAFANGILYKSEHGRYENNLKISMKRVTITDAILSGFESMAIILAYIIAFMIIIKTIDYLQILSKCFFFLSGEYSNIAVSFIKGLMEMTLGCSIIAENTCDMLLCSTLISFILSFSGLCVIGQMMSMLPKSISHPKDILIIKLTHGILSAVLTFSFGTFMIYF